MSGRDPNGPIIPPPPGVDSNFDNPTNNNELIIGVTSFTLTVTFIMVILRVYGQFIVLRRKPYKEDWIILPGLATYIACAVCVYLITNSTGFFVHGWDMRLRDLAPWRFIMFLNTTTYNATMVFLKTAILVQWTRIFVPGKRNVFYWLCYIVAAGNIIFYVTTILIEWLRCTPVQFYWDKTISGRCVEVAALSPASAILNLCFDIVILLLPQRVIWTLNMPRRKKIGVSVVFLVGILACVFASIRLTYALGYLSTGDFTYDPSWQVLYGSLELLCGFLTFCLPGIPKPLNLLIQQGRASLSGLVSKGRWSRTTTSRRDGTHTTGGIYNSAEDRDFVPLRDVGDGKSVNSKTGEEDGPLPEQVVTQIPGNRVLRSTQFRISESSDLEDPTSERISRQHPWMKQ